MCALYLRLTLELKYTNIILPLCSVHSIINSCFTALCNVVGWGGGVIIGQKQEVNHGRILVWTNEAFTQR